MLFNCFLEHVLKDNYFKYILAFDYENAKSTGFVTPLSLDSEDIGAIEVIYYFIYIYIYIYINIYIYICKYM